ncbi:MAG: response regulator [Deltaproteobacteria bacterium]|nr:response regulator [Deltaproteobacteria bacterium]
MTIPLRALIVEDVEADARLLLRELRRGGFEVAFERVETPERLVQALALPWDIVISDFSMPRLSAPRALELVKERDLDLPFIIVSGTVDEETAVEAMRAGANDFIAKGKFARLIPAVQRELRDARLRAERRKIQRTLLDTQQTLDAIVRCAPAFIVALDEAGRIKFVNHRLPHQAPDEIAGTAWLDYITPDDRDEVAERFRAVLATGESQAFETGLVGRDGATIPMSVHLGAMRSGERIVGIVAIALDISELRRVRRAKARMQEHLIVSDRMASVGILAAGVAHEINNPLASLMANLDLVAEDLTALGDRDELAEVHEVLGDARDAAARIRDIVRDLRMFSRSDEEKTMPVDVERVMESALRMAWNEIRHRARVVKDYQPAPPVLASESRLGQVFLNLIVNAAQAITEGNTQHNEIRISIGTDGDQAVIAIADTGAGMPPEVLGRLFTPFFTTKAAGHGTGLGLSICHRIVTGYDGAIDIQSAAGEGTTVRLSFPPAPAHLLEEPSPLRLEIAGRRRGRILVIEDEQMIARAVQRALSLEHEVIMDDSAEVALRRIAAGESFDVILCDLLMPQMTGMDLHAELVRVARDQADRMVFLTGGAFTPRARAFLDETPNPHIEKPFDALHLRALINSRVR